MEACSFADIDADASARVDGFLDCVEEKRRQASRTRRLVAVVGVVIGLVAYAKGIDHAPKLTMGVARAEARAIVADVAPLPTAR